MDPSIFSCRGTFTCHFISTWEEISAYKLIIHWQQDTEQVIDVLDDSSQAVVVLKSDWARIISRRSKSSRNLKDKTLKSFVSPIHHQGCFSTNPNWIKTWKRKLMVQAPPLSLELASTFEFGGSDYWAENWCNFEQLIWNISERLLTTKAAEDNGKD